MTEVTLSTPIRVVGETTVTVTDLATFPSRQRRVEVVCLSGDRYSGRWRGVPVSSLLERAGAPDSTTHLLVAAADGYRICVDVATVLEGAALLAYARDGVALADVADYETRFVAEGVDGPRTVKDVARLEAVSLAPGEDPEAYEELLLGEEGTA